MEEIGHQANRRKPECAPVTTLRALILFALVIFQSYFIEGILNVFGVGWWYGAVVETGLSAALVVPLLLYLFAPHVFSHRSWRFPRVAPWGIAVIAGMQLILNHLPPHDGPMPVLRTIGALTVAPVVEEAVRAVMLFSLQARWGTTVAVLATGLLNASVHTDPQVAMVQQLALTMVMLWTEGAIPANIIAHFAMNLTVVLHCGVANG